MSTAVLTSTHSTNTTSPPLQVSSRSTVSTTSRKSTLSMQDEATNLDNYAPVSNKSLKHLHSSLSVPIRDEERSHLVSDLDPDTKVFDNNFQIDSYNPSSARPNITSTMSTHDAAIRLNDRSRVNVRTNQSKDDYILPNEIKQILTEVAQSGTCTWLPWSYESLQANKQQTLSETGYSSLDASIKGKNDHSRIIHPTAVRAGADTHQKVLYRNGIHQGNASTEITRKRPLEMVIGSNKRASQCLNDYILTNNSESGAGEDTSLENAPEHATVGPDAAATSAASLERRQVWLSWERNQGERQWNKGILPEHTQQQTENHTGGYTSLREVFRVALAIVLDRYYQLLGYQLSPAEKWINLNNPVQHESVIGLNGDCGGIGGYGDTKNSERFYRLRRNVILSCLQKRSDFLSKSGRKIGQASTHKLNNTLEVPPFTLQRIAEVLLSPERYYTQTHKLCNCLEKLLLVTAPSYAFGGSEGGYNTQRLSEENEFASASDDKGRWFSSFGQNSQQLKSFGQSPAGTVLKEKLAAQKDLTLSSKCAQSVEKGNPHTKEELLDSRTSDSGGLLREKLEAAARASLRSKFDHVTVETPPATAVGNKEGETRARANSPPPPSLSLNGAAVLTIPGSHGGLLRHLSPGPASPTSPDTKDKSSSVIRTLSPLLFSSPNLHGDASSPSSGTSKIASPHNSPLHHSQTSGCLPPLELISLVHSSGTGKGVPASTKSDSETNDSFNDSTST